MRRLACVLLFAISTLAAGSDDFRPDFVVLTPAQRLVFLQSICPGHASAAGCDACPSGTSFPQDSWNLETAIFGHFQSATSDDAILSGGGCEPHVVGQGGSYLFTHEGSAWRKVRYTASYPLELCKKLTASDGRERLVCEQSDMHQGVEDTFLYLLDPVKESKDDPNEGVDVFLGFDDSLGSCVKLPDGTLVTGEIDSVQFTKLAKEPEVRISVKLLLGKASIPDRVLAQQCDGKGGTPTITTVPRMYQFLFDGKKVAPLGTNPKTENGWAISPPTSYGVKK